MTFISEAEMTAEYKPKALIEWFDSKYKSIAQSEAGKTALRMREGFCKEFIEEIYPLRVLAEFEFLDKEDIRIKWISGNQNYDALVLDSISQSRLEITNAVDETDYHRRWMINKEGWAPFNKNRMKKIGTKNSGNMRIEVRKISAMDLGDFFDMQIELIGKAIDKKSKKKYEFGTSLVVMFDDLDLQHVKFADKTLRNFVSEKFLDTKKFPKLYLIGSHRNVYVKV